MSRLVVTDTSCLIALDRVELLGLLPRLYSELFAPRAVIAEFGRCPSWLREEVVEDRDAVRRLLLRGLHEGEAEALVLAQGLPDALLLLDERRARRVAAGLDLPVLGTAGLLAIARREGLIPALRPVLDALIEEHAFRLSRSLYEEVLREVGEQE